MVPPAKEEEIHQSVHETDPESDKVTFIVCENYEKDEKMAKCIALTH